MREIGRAYSGNSHSMALESASDPSRIDPSHEIGDILALGRFGEGSVIHAGLAIFFKRTYASVGFREIPGFYDGSRVSNHFAVGFFDVFYGIGRTEFVPVSEILLKNVRIVGTVVGFSGKFPVLGLGIEIRVASRCDDDGLFLFHMVAVARFGQSFQIVFEREFVNEDDFPVFVADFDLSAEKVVVHGPRFVPRRFSIPIFHPKDVGFEKCRLAEPYGLLLHDRAYFPFRKDEAQISSRGSFDFEPDVLCERP